jgi:dihydroxyacetone kinase-like protein
MAKKIINDPDAAVSEMMEGFIAAHSRYYEKAPGANGVLCKQRRKDKVTLVIGGGSGHEPMFSGFVGRGLADAAACGNIFASPDPGTICEVARAAHGGKGVLFVYGNYAGDNLNFDMAEEMLQEEGIATGHVRVWDDCASAPPERIEDRRGIAGDVFVVKIAGAACDAGFSLEGVVAAAEKARANMRTIGVASSPGQIPGNDKPTFELGEHEIEYGMGLHGEPGIERTAMKPADELTRIMYQNLTKDMPLEKGSEVCVLVNGLGSTTILEMSIVFRSVKRLLDADGVEIYDGAINSFCTCMEMGGFSITLMKLDGALKSLYDAPCYCPYYAREGR